MRNQTIAWSPRVGEVWINRVDAERVEVVAEHADARLLKLQFADGESDWMPVVDFERDYVQSCCDLCGVPLTEMRRLLIEEAQRAAVAPAAVATRLEQPPAKSKPGTYCTKPCCATRHAPKTC